MRIRTAHPADLAEIMKLEREAEGAAHWSPNQYDAILSGKGPRRQVLVIDDGHLQGFLVARTDSEEWEIENIAVAETARRHGLGGQLLGELMLRARGERVKAISLDVRESNRAARSLYGKWGFREAGQRRRYYRNPDEDAIVYRFCFV